MTEQSSDKSNLQIISPKIGNALNALICSGTESSLGQISLEEFAAATPDLMEPEVMGAISLLQALGLVSVDSEGNIRITSKHANFALGSLTEFLIRSRSFAVSKYPSDSDVEFLKTLTRAMETIRKEKIGMDKPLHSRDIINIVIKGKQIRGWHEKDVYLHVFHKKWRAYHLVGLGRKVATRSIDKVAERAMEIKLKLKPFQYEIDPSLKPVAITYVAISGSHGAITQYTIYTRVLKSLSVNLNDHLKKMIDDNTNDIDLNTFRWFSLEEIENGASESGDPIIQSTPRVLSNISNNYVSCVINNATHFQEEPNLKRILSNRIRWQRGVLLILAFVFSLLIMFFLDDVIDFINVQNEFINKLADISQILGVLLAAITLIIAMRDSN